jgi:uncharacterized coiled-coil protein SlyX
LLYSRRTRKTRFTYPTNATTRKTSGKAMSGDLIKRLRDAADAVMAHQWSGDSARMGALQDLCFAEKAAADALEAQDKRIEELEGAAPLCDKHKPNGGKRAVCLICALQAQSAALSQISYLCVPPNEMEFGPYDLHWDESAVVEQVRAQAKRIAELETALQSEKDEVFRLQCSHSALYARVQALESDAARYRWLRSGDHWPAAFADCHAPEPLLGSDLDAAIDAALKEKQ